MLLAHIPLLNIAPDSSCLKSHLALRLLLVFGQQGVRVWLLMWQKWSSFHPGLFMLILLSILRYFPALFPSKALLLILLSVFLWPYTQFLTGVFPGLTHGAHLAEGVSTSIGVQQPLRCFPWTLFEDLCTSVHFANLVFSSVVHKYLLLMAATKGCWEGKSSVVSLPFALEAVIVGSLRSHAPQIHISLQICAEVKKTVLAVWCVNVSTTKAGARVGGHGQGQEPFQQQCGVTSLVINPSFHLNSWAKLKHFQWDTDVLFQSPECHVWKKAAGQEPTGVLPLFCFVLFFKTFPLYGCGLGLGSGFAALPATSATRLCCLHVIENAFCAPCFSSMVVSRFSEL